MICLLGDLGGVTGVICLVFGYLIYPISEASYNLLTAKRMFLVYTYNNDIFPNQADQTKKWLVIQVKKF